MLVLLFVALWFILRGDLFYVLPCVMLFLCFFSPFSTAITSLGEERANLSAFRTFVLFALVWICRFPLPLCVWEGLLFVIVALPELFSYLFFLMQPKHCLGTVNIKTELKDMAKMRTKVILLLPLKRDQRRIIKSRL